MDQLRLIKPVVCAVLFIAGSAAYGFEQDMPAGAKFFPEQSQDQVRQQQVHTGKIGIVGSTEPLAASEGTSGIVSSGSDRGSFTAAEVSKAQNSFATADQRVKGGRDQADWWAALLVMAGLLILGGLGVKVYSDKVVPLPRSLQ